MGDVTSPSSNSEDTMFPAANVDVNSAFPNDTQSLEGSLSSPPSSQRQGQQNDSVMDHAEEFETGKTDFGRSVEDRFAPGASWKNKKANDEWNRAWASVEDKSFSLSKLVSTQTHVSCSPSVIRGVW